MGNPWARDRASHFYFGFGFVGREAETFVPLTWPHRKSRV